MNVRREWAEFLSIINIYRIMFPIERVGAAVAADINSNNNFKCEAFVIISIYEIPSTNFIMQKVLCPKTTIFLFFFILFSKIGINKIYYHKIENFAKYAINFCASLINELFDEL